MAKALKINTRSFQLFKAIQKARRGATVEQLSAASSIKVPHMGSYIAELKRVYGANVEYNTQKKRYFIKNPAEVKAAFLARFPQAAAKAPRMRKSKAAEVSAEVQASA